jgi:mono/diheme cytochrome c family protein
LPTATPAAINPPELAVPAPTEEAAVEPTATLSPPPTATPAPAVESAGVSFAADVMPLLERRCIKCHGGEKPEGGLRIEEGLDMRTLEGLLAGSINGPVIEPGNAQVSYLVEQITKGEMPKKEPRLLPREIRLITEWINAGAPDN